MVQALKKRGIEALFPIQKNVFDPAMAGQDLVGRARTGSGKTLAFSLPIIERLLSSNKEGNGGVGRRSPRAVVLTPTRELAKQVATEFESATDKRDGIKVITVYGGTPIRAQVREIERGIDVIVGTPGRIIDLIEKQRCCLLASWCLFIVVWSGASAAHTPVCASSKSWNGSVLVLTF
jgi:ATP-dependent RNA helicase DDX21